MSEARLGGTEEIRWWKLCKWLCPPPSTLCQLFPLPAVSFPPHCIPSFPRCVYYPPLPARSQTAAAAADNEGGGCRHDTYLTTVYQMFELFWDEVAILCLILPPGSKSVALVFKHPNLHCHFTWSCRRFNTFTYGILLLQLLIFKPRGQLLNSWNSVAASTWICFVRVWLFLWYCDLQT